MKVRTTGSSEFGEHVRMLLAGHPGSGKSRFAATAPNPLFVNAHGGMMSLADKNVRYVNMTSEADLLALKMMLQGWDATVEEHFGGPVETLVIDTLDEMQRILLSERLVAQKRTETTPSDWGWLGQRMHTIVDGLTKLPMHVIFVCHLKEVSDGATGQLFMKPGLQGSFTDQVSQYVDFALLAQSRSFSTQTTADWEMGVEDPTVSQGEHYAYRYIRSYPDNLYEWVKDFSGALPAEFEVNHVDDFQRIHELVVAAKQAAPESIEYEEVTLPSDAAEDLKRESLGVDKIITSSLQVPAEGAPQYTVNVADVAPPEAKTEAPKQVIDSGPAAAEASSDMPSCTDCGGAVESQDRVDLSMIRYRVPLCWNCFTARRTS